VDIGSAGGTARRGNHPHLAEPADTAALRGRKRHAKTDKTDSRHIRSHLAAGDLPECWIPPGHVLEARAVVRLYKDLPDERGGWHQRIAAALFHQGVPVTASMATASGRAAVGEMQLSPAGRQAVETGLRQIDRLTGELEPLRRQLDMISRRQPGCRALRATQFGVGAVTSVAIWAELGDVRRFGSSDNVVRHTGLDITVYSSDGKRSAGHLSRQGPQLVRWALYESAKCAARPAAPDHGYYTATRVRRTGGLATCRFGCGGRWLTFPMRRRLRPGGPGPGRRAWPPGRGPGRNRPAAGVSSCLSGLVTIHSASSSPMPGDRSARSPAWSSRWISSLAASWWNS
jgi:transposase